MNLLHFEFERRIIESGDIARDLIRLRKLTESGNSFRTLMHQVMFTVNGYDLDIRGLSQIPEVRAYFKSLAAHWPFFFHFSIPLPLAYGWLFHILYLKDNGIVDGEIVYGRADNDTLKRFFAEWFNNANILCQDFNMDEGEYQRRQQVMIDNFIAYINGNKT